MQLLGPFLFCFEPGFIYLGLGDVGAHRACAVHQKTNVEVLCLLDLLHHAEDLELLQDLDALVLELVDLVNELRPRVARGS